MYIGTDLLLKLEGIVENDCMGIDLLWIFSTRTRTWNPPGLNVNPRWLFNDYLLIQVVFYVLHNDNRSVYSFSKINGFYLIRESTLEFNLRQLKVSKGESQEDVAKYFHQRNLSRMVGCRKPLTASFLKHTLFVAMQRQTVRLFYENNCGSIIKI